MSLTQDALRLLHDGALALAQVEANGMRVDVDYLHQAIADTNSDIRELEDDIRADPIFSGWRKRFGDKTNLGSREQLAVVLSKDLGYTGVVKTEDELDSERSSLYKTDGSTLDSLDNPFVKMYVRCEQLKKLANTFLAGIARETIEGYCHPFFNLHIARTIRSSSDSPNFQNLPIRSGEAAKLIRQAFIPRDGHCIVEIDFSGIEVRVAACYHKDPTMLEYIRDPSKDMHRDMASQLYKLPTDTPKEWWKKKGPGGGHDVRHAAKNMYVFPQFYGDYYVNCAASMWEAIERQGMTTHDRLSLYDHLAMQGIDGRGECDPKERPMAGTFEDHVRAVERDFWGRRFGVYGGWKKTWYEAYLRTGGFRTLTGFYISGILGRNDVINYPVQGSAFHCLLWSLIQLQRWLAKYDMRTKIVGQIHDSMVLDVHVAELDDVLYTAKTIMTKSLPKAWRWLIVPLDVEAEVAPAGRSWYEKQPVSIPL